MTNRTSITPCWNENSCRFSSSTVLTLQFNLRMFILINEKEGLAVTYLTWTRWTIVPSTIITLCRMNGWQFISQSVIDVYALVHSLKMSSISGSDGSCPARVGKKDGTPCFSVWVGIRSYSSLLLFHLFLFFFSHRCRYLRCHSV